MTHRQARSPLFRLGAVAAAVLMFAAACGSASTPIATNDGGVLVQPPDVLSGETEVVDGSDPRAGFENDIFDADFSGDDDAAPSSGDAEALKPAPEVDFVWFDGEQGSVSALQGTPTVLNFWASNCAACIAEMPEFEEVFVDIGDEVAFVGMNTGDVRDSAVRLAEQTGVTYPLAEDVGSEVFRGFGGFVMPTTVFLTPEGEVGYVWSGVLTGDELRILIDRHIAPGTLT